MKMRLFTAAAAAIALLPLAACDHKPEVVDSRDPDPMAEQLKNAPKVELPPAIKATVSMRCQPGNALVFADFFEGDKIVAITAVKDGPKTRLTAPAAGEPFTADGGYKLVGNSKSATVTIPGKGTLTCKS
ncbi:hypothetical protein [Sphingomonas sp.]|uniref:hypothetical protein n=1 Tax=Sphingomonas sp. TaxID=28214 RepID=UPI001ED2130B|nr:hypothetical protein [Sphingomonas sp.]MBX3594276.1 hypothetical protein [Sphingomonas sp.]